VYGNMRIQDLVHTTIDPTTDGSGIPYGTQLLGFNWTLTHRGTTLGATVGWEHARLNEVSDDQATFDMGLRQDLPGRIWLSIASHLFAPLTEDKPVPDLFGGIEWAAWRGASWKGSGQATLAVRYGAAVAHGSPPDHQFGLGLAFSQSFAVDVRVIHEETYGSIGWRGSAGVRIGIGRYRVTYARDTGANDIGSAYRVGLEAGVK